METPSFWALPQGTQARIRLPLNQIGALAMTLPDLISKALQSRYNDETLRYAYPLASWTVERSSEPGTGMMTLSTTDGFSVCFSMERELQQTLADALASDSAKNWENRLTAMDVPCAGILAISEIVHHPQLAHRDVLQKVQSDEGELTLVGSGFRLAHGGGSIDRPPPKIGEHNAEILGEAGYGSAEIAALVEEGVV